ncbi:hypothetical protein MRX96_013438 [Rhipicephalus microplus]
MSRSPRSVFRKFPLRSASPEDRSSPSPLATAARLRRHRPRTHPTASAPCGFALALPTSPRLRPATASATEGGVRAPAPGGPRASCGRSNGVSESCSRSPGKVEANAIGSSVARTIGVLRERARGSKFQRSGGGAKNSALLQQCCFSIKDN